MATATLNLDIQGLIPTMPKIFQRVNRKAEADLLRSVWIDLKSKADGGTLFIEMGDFVIAFWEDAEDVAKTLGLVASVNADSVPLITFRKSHYSMYARMLAASGHDVWRATQHEVVEAEAITWEASDAFRILRGNCID